LAEIQEALYQRALAFRDSHIQDVSSYEELKTAVETGFARAYWDGSSDDEKRIQDELKATIRVIPQEQPDQPGRCFLTGRETSQQVLFARAY
ncbi:MAG: proline--tRNA ligase, partial [Chloroflexi bacterium]|nr:proline--tRNA ligase [Chloroflexota bacterium]